MDHTQLHAYLHARGPMTRKNPALIQLHERTGFSIEHLYLVATGHRPLSRPCLMALDRELKNKSDTVRRKELPRRPRPA